MRTYRHVWRFAAGASAVAAIAGTVATVPVAPILSILVTLALFGSVMGYALAQVLPEVRHPVLGGALLFVAPAGYPGLTQLLGFAATAVVGVLLLTSPLVVGLVGKWIGPHVSPPPIEVAGLAGPDEALRRQWIESTRQLKRAATVDQLMLVVQVRDQILEDIIDRTDGQLPDYVWSTSDPWSGHDHSAGDHRQPS